MSENNPEENHVVRPLTRLKEQIVSGVMVRPTRCVAVFERRPFWGPELQRQLAEQQVEVRECRSVQDLDTATKDVASAVVLLDLESAPAECLGWLGRQIREPHARSVIACVSADLADLEWTVREAGAVAFVSDEVTGAELARLCLRQLRLA